MKPAPTLGAGATGERITREVIRAQAMNDATPDIWATVGDANQIWKMGTGNSTAQTYNAAALTGLLKG